MQNIKRSTTKKLGLFSDNLLGLNLRCVNCGIEKFNDSCLCETCKKLLPIITGKTCNKCGCAIYGDNNYCTNCADVSQYYTKAYSVCEYKDLAKSLIYKVKFGSNGYITKTMAEYMAQVLILNNVEFDYVVYVPISKKSLKSRGFNQSYLLSISLCDILNKQIIDNALIKIKDNISQEKLSRKERALNVKNCFELNKEIEPVIKGKKILLVDDVKTSGATANECCRLLRMAKEIYLITFASVKQSLVFD